MNRTGTVTMRMAAIQARSLPGQVAANLEHATGLTEQAAARGARLVVLPELFGCGYVPNRRVWDTAEPVGGPTERWLADTAGRLGIYLGAGTVQADGSDFFNVFIMADPDGRIVGRAYKANAEASIFRRGRRAHLIITPDARIGVGICADNQFTAQLRLMHQQRADLILMPHAWPTPARPGGLVSAADVASSERRIADLPALYARALGVPVVFVNQTGPLLPIGGILGRLIDPAIWALRGQSRIIDSDGTLLGQLDDTEGMLTRDVTLDPDRRHYDPQPGHGGWLQPGPWAERHVIIPFDIAGGKLSYALSRQRRRKAQTASMRETSATARPAATT
jgi:N-carbamoylputrescine amidase